MMKTGGRDRSSAVLLTALLGACSWNVYEYQPQQVARGELTMRVRRGGGVEFYGGSQPVASVSSWLGLTGNLDGYVRCVPRAKMHAQKAQSFSFASIGLGALSAVLTISGLSLMGQDETLSGRAFGVGLAAALTGGTAVGLRYQVVGHAVDAMNYYNDAVGSLGATCRDLAYEPPRSIPAPHADKARPVKSNAQR